jgi:hypothetical protein
MAGPVLAVRHREAVGRHQHGAFARVERLAGANLQADARARAVRREQTVEDVEVAVQAGDAAPGVLGLADFGLAEVEIGDERVGHRQAPG